MQRAFIPVCLAISLGACLASNGDEGIIITKNVAVSGDACTFTSSAGEAFLPHGTISTYATSGYKLIPQMQSRITALAGQEDQRTILVRGARVDIAFADSSLDDLKADGLTHFEALFSAPLPPNGGIIDGFFDLVPIGLIEAIAARAGTTERYRTELIATIKVFGDMAGSEITSQDFQFPVTVCNDCVVNIVGACPLPLGSTVSAGNPCNPYQDGVIDCCQDATAGLVCPATVSDI